MEDVGPLEDETSETDELLHAHTDLGEDPGDFLIGCFQSIRDEGIYFSGNIDGEGNTIGWNEAGKSVLLVKHRADYLPEHGA